MYLFQTPDSEPNLPESDFPETRFEKIFRNVPSRSISPEPSPVSTRRPFTVGIIGGSQGAHAINLAVIQALSLLKGHGCHFIHQTGQADLQMVQDAYLRHGISSTVQPFFRDMTDCYQQADLMICRSGATTVAEITAIGKPAILIPFPHAADNHQVLNAGLLVQSQAAEMILESDLTGSALAERILFLASNPEMLAPNGFSCQTTGESLCSQNHCG